MSKMLSLVFRHYVRAVFAASLLISASAHAGQSRGLSLATAEVPPPNETIQPAPSVSQPPAAGTPTAAPETKSAAPTEPTTAAKPIKKHVSVEARIIYQLHRHGIYW